MRLPDEVGALVVERRIQEEPLVIELEVLLRLADAALAQSEELFALGQRSHGDGPFFESNRHKKKRGLGGCKRSGAGPLRRRATGTCGIVRTLCRFSKYPWKFTGFPGNCGPEATRV